MNVTLRQLLPKIVSLILLLVPSSGIAQVNFLAYDSYLTGSHAEVVAIADLNNDGLNDIALGTGFYFDTINDYKLFIFTQNALGNLNAPVQYTYPPVYPGLEAISSGDLNNDSLVDVVIGYGDSIGIFYQNSQGTLDPVISYYSGTLVDGVKAGDLNNDSLIDIVVSHWNESFIKVFYQDTTGFDTVIYVSPDAGFDEIDIGDINDDGLNDVVFMPGGTVQGIRVYYQNPSGYLDSAMAYLPPSSVTGSFTGIAIGDLNSDGRNDVTATGVQRLTVWFQDTISGLLQNPIDTLTAIYNPEPVEIADLNCDGANEIILVNGGWNAFSVQQRDSIGNFGTSQSFYVPYASHYKPQGLSIGDINSDGKSDVVIADYNNGLIWCINVSTGPCDTVTSSNIIWTSHFRDGEVSIFPNPFQTDITIDFVNTEEQQHADLQIYDANGVMKFFRKINDSYQKLNLTTLASGVYVLTLSYKEKKIFKKIVKMN